MRLVLRAVLVWLMVLALPVQGFAVAAMLHCGPAQGPVSLAAEGVQTVDTAAAADHAHHHQAGAADAHVDVDAHANTHADAVAADVPADVHSHHAAAGDRATGDHQCSVCAACCLALALPAAMIRLQPVLVDATFSRSALPALPSFVPTGLDRPPRPTLA